MEKDNQIGNMGILSEKKWRTGRKNGGAVILAIALLGLFLAAGCSKNPNVRLPPVTAKPSGDIYLGKFVWMDLLTEDMTAAASFYSGLFGWRAAKSNANFEYYVFYVNDKPIAGMIQTANRDKKAPESLWLLSLSVADVDKAVARITKLGGNVLEPPHVARGRGRMALVEDPAGAPFILLRAHGGDPPQGTPETGEWLWTDLFTPNADKAGSFYSSFMGYRAERIDAPDKRQYLVLKQGGHPRAGIVTLDWEGLTDNWLPYFTVGDIDTAIEKARRLGGRLVLETEDVAILLDPAGAAFGIQQYPAP